MFFLLSKLGGALLDLGTLLAILILSSSAAALSGRPRWMTAFQSVAVAIIVMFGVLPGTAWIALPLELRFPENPPLPERVDGIIVLGGTERVEATASWGQPMLNDPTPIAAMMALSRRYPHAKLVFSGGYHSRRAPDIGESDVVRAFLDEIGADSRKVVYEERSRNTWENALFSRALMNPATTEHWILVCQAIGMPRAVGVFRQAGWNVIPFPAGYMTGGPKFGALSIDVLGGLSVASVALHEWVGLLAYRAMGYTGELFPH